MAADNRPTPDLAPSEAVERSPQRTWLLRMTWLLLVLAVAWVLSGHRQAPGPHPPLALEIVQADGTRTAIMASSGWPLTLDFTTEDIDFLGFGFAEAPRQLPRQDDVGYLIFEDPDGCPSWLSPDWQKWLVDSTSTPLDDPSLAPCRALPLPWPRDERWLEITPGISGADGEGCGQRPFLRVFDLDDTTDSTAATGSNRTLQEVGPCVGSLHDGYGYGSLYRLPGLVVLADSGPGIITDEFFDRPQQETARNLAGFFQSVAYEIMAADGHTRVTAHLNVPRGLFTPLVVHDSSPGELCPGSRNGGFAEAVRIDGGPVRCDTHFDLDEHTVTVQAFVVDGHAPDELADIDEDGEVTSADAVAAGYVLLSNAATLQFRQLHEFPEPPFLIVDLDGNGEAGGPPPSPVGPGGLTPPPR